MAYNNKNTREAVLKSLDLKNWIHFFVGTYTNKNQGLEEGLDATIIRFMKLVPHIKASSKILVLSNGNTFLPIYLATKYGCSITVACENEEVLSKLNKEIEEYELTQNISTQIIDYQHLPFNYDQFDMAWTVGALHHRNELLTILRELRRVIVPQGRLVLCEMAGDLEDQPSAGLPILYSINEIINMASRADLEKVYMKEFQQESITHYQKLTEAIGQNENQLKKDMGSKAFEASKVQLKELSALFEKEKISWGFLQFQKRNN